MKPGLLGAEKAADAAPRQDAAAESRVELDAELAALRAENASLRTDAERSARHVELLISFGQSTTAALGVEPLVARALEVVIRALAVDAAAIHVVRGERLALLGVRDSRGEALEAARALLADVAIDERTTTGRAALHRRTVLVDRRSWPEGSSPLVSKLDACCAAATPLTVGDRLIGTILIVRREDRPMSEVELRLLETCAAHLGAAIEHARLLEDERRRVQDLSAINELGGLIAQHLELSAVLSTGVRHLARITGISNIFLMLRDGPDLLRVAASSIEDPFLATMRFPLSSPSTSAEAIRLRAPVVIDDASRDPRAAAMLAERYGHRSVLAVPLIAQGEAIGAIVLGETRAGHRFTSAEVDRALAIGNQLASAIVNARLYEEERRRVEELHLLLEIGRVITATLDLQQILDAGAGHLAQMIGATHSFIWLLEPDQMLRGAATSAPEWREHFSRVRLPLDAPTLASRAVVTRAPVQAVDAFGSSEVNQELNATYRMKSLLALPLMLRDEPIGSAVIGDAARERAWTEPEIERATVVARHLAVAIANAKLFEDLKRSYEKLERTQEVLVERERLAALGELAAVVAHEVRNPLGIIWNSLGSLRRLLKPSGDVAMLLEILGEESDRLNRIVGDLLDFARPHSPELGPEPLEAILNGAIEGARGAGLARHVQFIWDRNAPLPPVLGDARLLRQAILNLVINAIQAMPGGGHVTLRAVLEARGDETVARIDVSDEGPGIPESAASQVFQPFFTTKATGTGLGLAVVKRIVDAHHGEVAVESTNAEGTTFTVRLPLAPR